MKRMTLSNAGHSWARAQRFHGCHQAGNDGASSNRLCPVWAGSRVSRGEGGWVATGRSRDSVRLWSRFPATASLGFWTRTCRFTNAFGHRVVLDRLNNL